MPRRARIALVGAACGVVLLVLTWILTRKVGFFMRLDRSILSGFADLQVHQLIYRVAYRVANLCDPNPYVFLAAIPAIAALVRRRPRVLLAVGVILLGANLTTQLLKPLLPPLPSEILYNINTTLSGATWPSGHATAAMSLAMCCVIAAPPRLRPAVAALGAAFSVAVSYSFLALVWHYPSDVFGGFLVAWTWTMLAVAGISIADARWPRAVPAERTPRVSMIEVVAPQVALLVGALIVAGVIALARPHQVVVYTRAHEAFVLGAAAIGVLALVLATAITMTVSRR